MKQLSKELDVSLNVLAERAGIDRRYIAKIANNHVRQPGWFKIQQIAKGFGIPVDVLLDGVELSGGKKRPDSKKKKGGAVAAAK